MNRRTFLGGAGAASLRAAAKESRPNILFAIADDWSWPFTSETEPPALLPSTAWLARA